VFACKHEGRRAKGKRPTLGASALTPTPAKGFDAGLGGSIAAAAAGGEGFETPTLANGLVACAAGAGGADGATAGLPKKLGIAAAGFSAAAAGAGSDDDVGRPKPSEGGKTGAGLGVGAVEARAEAKKVGGLALLPFCSPPPPAEEREAGGGPAGVVEPPKAGLGALLLGVAVVGGKIEPSPNEKGLRLLLAAGFDDAAVVVEGGAAKKSTGPTVFFSDGSATPPVVDSFELAAPLSRSSSLALNRPLPFPPPPRPGVEPLELAVPPPAAGTCCLRVALDRARREDFAAADEAAIAWKDESSVESGAPRSIVAEAGRAPNDMVGGADDGGFGAGGGTGLRDGLGGGNESEESAEAGFSTSRALPFAIDAADDGRSSSDASSSLRVRCSRRRRRRWRSSRSADDEPGQETDCQPSRDSRTVSRTYRASGVEDKRTYLVPRVRAAPPPSPRRRRRPSRYPPRPRPPPPPPPPPALVPSGCHRGDCASPSSRPAGSLRAGTAGAAHGRRARSSRMSWTRSARRSAASGRRWWKRRKRWGCESVPSSSTGRGQQRTP